VCIARTSDTSVFGLQLLQCLCAADLAKDIKKNETLSSQQVDVALKKFGSVNKALWERALTTENLLVEATKFLGSVPNPVNMLEKAKVRVAGQGVCV